MEKQAMINQTNEILTRYEAVEKLREDLLATLKAVFPVKEGDKVEIRYDHDGVDKHVRFAYVNKIQIKLRGIDRKAKVEFDLQKCKADGSIGQHGDYLRTYEYLTKIK